MVIHADLTLNTKGRFIRRCDSFFGTREVVTMWSWGPFKVRRHVWPTTYSTRIPELKTVEKGWYTFEIGDVIKLGKHRRWSP